MLIFVILLLIFSVNQKSKLFFQVKHMEALKIETTGDLCKPIMLEDSAVTYLDLHIGWIMKNNDFVP